MCRSHGLLLEPIKCLRRGVSLIIVLAVREGGQLMQVLAQSGCFIGEVNKTILNCAGDRIHPHDFVHRWFVLLDRMHSLADQLLDQLRARRFVFDQDRFRSKRLRLISHRTLQFRIAEALAKDMK